MVPVSPEVEARLRTWKKSPLVPVPPAPEAIFGVERIEALIPHRPPFRWIAEVWRADADANIVGATLCRASLEPVFAGHFPGEPVVPGVLQIEAVAQSAAVGMALRAAGAHQKVTGFAMAHVVGATFRSKIDPDAPAYVLAWFEPGAILTTIVGQCVQRGKVCSLVALTGVGAAVVDPG